jgi:AraC-like DNA-binding protein
MANRSNWDEDNPLNVRGITSTTSTYRSPMEAKHEGKHRSVNAGQDPKLLRRLQRAKDRMDAASHEAWPMQRLAEVSGVSKAHFARSFKAAFGVPPHRYLLTRKLERAKVLLRDTDKPIIEIAFRPAGTVWGRSGARFATSWARVRASCGRGNRPPPRSLCEPRPASSALPSGPTS